MLFVPLLAVPAVLAGPGADAPPPGAADLDALVAKLASHDAGERLAAANALAAEPASGIDAYAQRLARPRTLPVETYRQIVLAIWAQVPNPTPNGPLYVMKPEPPWKPPPRVPGAKGPRPRRPPPHDPEKVDWLAALAALDVDGDPALAALPDRWQARAEALEAVALLRALSASGRGEAVDPLFDFAFVLEGVFRDECGRCLRALGPVGVPGLIRRQYKPGKAMAKQHRYAAYQLDRMDRARPSKAVATAPDDRLRAAILHEYGEARALDAVATVLDQVDASSRQVRREARAGWLRYVQGPPPPAAPRRKRKLPGGREESEEKEDYLNYREMAVLALDAKVVDVLKNDPAAAARPDDKLAPGLAELRALAEKERRARAALGAEPEKAERPAKRAAANAANALGKGCDDLTQALFEYYDARRAAEWDALFDAATAKRDRGDLAGAIADYSTILGHDPFYRRRAAMAPAFVAWAQARPEAERARLLREAIALAPDAADAKHLEAEVAYLDGKLALDAGRPDPLPLRRALALEPSHAGARALLASITGKKRRTHWLEGGLAATAALLLVAILVTAGRRLRRRRAPVS